MKYRYVTNMYKGFKETFISLFNNFRADAILTRTGAFDIFQYGHYLSFINWTKKIEFAIPFLMIQTLSYQNPNPRQTPMANGDISH